MGTHIIRLESPSLCIGLLRPSPTHTAKVGRWTISENYAPSPDAELRQRGLGIYTIALEREVSTLRDIWDVPSEANELIEQLDIGWCYSRGLPFSVPQVKPTEITAPAGWLSNLGDVEKRLQREVTGFTFDVRIVSNTQYWLDELPLEYALFARHAYVTADTTVRRLAELHVAALTSPAARLFLLAKCLEIVGGLISPSWAREKRNAMVQELMVCNGINLTQTVEWLFNTANERFDIRHAWDRKSSALHPALTPHERAEFIENSDLVVRAFVCDRLSLEFPPISRPNEDPPNAGRWNGNTLEFDT